MKNVNIPILIAIFPIACVSTPKVSRVDKANEKLIVYSTNDSRTTIDENNSLYSDIIEDLEKKIKTKGMQPNIPLALNLVQLLIVESRLDEAESYTKAIIRKNLKHVGAKKALAQIYLKRNKHDLCAIVLNSIGGENVRDSQVLNMLAQVALHHQKHDDAVRLFKKAIKINPNDTAVRMNLGILHLKYRQLSKASIQFERILKTVPKHSDAKLHLAIIRSINGNESFAKEVFEQVLDQDEENQIALYNYAVLDKRKQRYEDAMDKLKVYLKGNKVDAEEIDEVLALIEEIQGHQGSAGKVISNQEIQELALKMRAKKKRVKKAAKPSPVAENNELTSKAESPSKQPAKPAAKKKRDRLEEEIEQLESLLK